MANPTSSRDGGPAFPADAFAAQHCPGMSLRDWFAGQALAGFLASQTSKEYETDSWVTDARCAYALADAMLAERSKEPS